MLSPALQGILGGTSLLLVPESLPPCPYQLRMTDTSLSPQSLCLGLCVCDHAAPVEVSAFQSLSPLPWVGRGFRAVGGS